MDCEMPFMDGFEACQEIITFLTGYAIPIPHIIAVTGHTNKQHNEKCLRSGMEHILHKPVDPNELKSII
jgi:CheY-like chemotaxis protein